MTGMDSSTASSIISPDAIGPLITVPLQTASTAFAVSTVVETPSASMRFPVVLQDPSAAWTAEAAPISPSDGVVSELVCTPAKLSSITKCSNELIADSLKNASALNVLSDGIVRDLARKCDSSYFGFQVTNSPKGLGDLEDAQEIPVVGGWADFQWAVDALTAAQNVGAKLTSFVAASSTVNKLMKIPAFQGTGSTSNAPALSTTDVTAPLGTAIFGVPLHAVPDGTMPQDVVYGISAPKAFVVLRSGTSIEVDRSIYFESDCSAIRSVLRVSWCWPHPQAVIRITGGGGS